MTTITVDGLVFKGAGWNDLVASSGLSAIHVTAADFLTDFDEVCVQITRWREWIRRDEEHLFLVRDVADLDRIGSDGRTGVILGLQNAAQVGTDPHRVDVLWELGIRVLQLTYNEANLLADGCLEARDAGLTRIGRDVIRACNALGMVIDVSHVGHASSLDAAQCSEQPIAVTHANRASVTPNPRNKSDELLTEVAGKGGVIGVSPYGPMCWNGHEAPRADDFLRHIHAMIELVGADAVGIGTDFPAVEPSADVDAILQRSLERYPEVFGAYVETLGNGLAQRYCHDLPTLASWTRLPDLLEGSGVTDDSLAGVLGGNWIDFFRRVWSGERV